MTAQPRPPTILILTSIVLALVGLYLGIGGIWLLVLGGSPYYVIAGLAFLLTAWLVWRRKAAAFWVYAALLFGTLAWALWEVGFDFWQLAPRGDIIAPLGVWLLLPFVANRIATNARGGNAAVGGCVGFAVANL